MAAKWGNPETASFERQYLRLARYGDHTVQVHKFIWPMAERTLVWLDSLGLDVNSIEPLADPLRRGFRLEVADPALIEQIADGLRDAQFTFDGHAVQFYGDAEQAQALSAKVSEAAVVEEPEPEPVPVSEGRDPKAPFEHTLVDGPVASFVQHLVSAEVTGEVDEQTRERLKGWQRTHGVEPTGELDEGTWSNIVPRRAQWLRPGQTGGQIKVLQAAFKTHGYFDSPITGVWGIEFSRSPRRFQHDHSIHPRLRVGPPEWRALFGEWDD